jgi:hypothetical protein
MAASSPRRNPPRRTPGRWTAVGLSHEHRRRTGFRHAPRRQSSPGVKPRPTHSKERRRCWLVRASHTRALSAGNDEPASAYRRADFVLAGFCAASALRQLSASELHVGCGERGMPEMAGRLRRKHHPHAGVRCRSRRAGHRMLRCRRRRRGMARCFRGDLAAGVFAPGDRPSGKHQLAGTTNACRARGCSPRRRLTTSASSPARARRLKFKDVSRDPRGRDLSGVLSLVDGSGPFADVSGHSLVHARTIVAF